jgi:hypothetical protein
MSDSERGMPGGTPSTMHPTDRQWDSPYVVTRKALPKVDILGGVGLGLRGGGMRIGWREGA